MIGRPFGREHDFPVLEARDAHWFPVNFKRLFDPKCTFCVADFDFVLKAALFTARLAADQRFGIATNLLFRQSNRIIRFG